MDEIEVLEVLHRRVLGAFRRKANRSGAKERTAPSLWEASGTLEREGSSKTLSPHRSNPQKKNNTKVVTCAVVLLYWVSVNLCKP